MRCIELAAGQPGPVGLVDPLGVDLLFPEDLDLFTLCVVLQTREANKRLVAGQGWQFDILNQVAPRTDANDVARFRRNVEC